MSRQFVHLDGYAQDVGRMAEAIEAIVETGKGIVGTVDGVLYDKGGAPTQVGDDNRPWHRLTRTQFWSDSLPGPHDLRTLDVSLPDEKVLNPENLIRAGFIAGVTVYVSELQDQLTRPVVPKSVNGPEISSPS